VDLGAAEITQKQLQKLKRKVETVVGNFRVPESNKCSGKCRQSIRANSMNANQELSLLRECVACNVPPDTV